MNNKYCIYTAIYGSYDELKIPQYLDPETDYICFTDNPKLKSDVYEIRYSKATNEDPNRSAKIFKISPHKYLREYNYSLWIDGSVNIIKIKMDEMVNQYLTNTDMALFKHPERNCIYEEYKVCMNLQKDTPQIMTSQIHKYQKEGFPKQYGLAEGTMILRRHNTPKIIKFNERWWKEISENSKRDQLSFNYVVWKTGTKYSLIEGTTNNNKYIEVKPHRIITNELTTKEYIEVSEKYHSLGKEHDKLYKEKLSVENRLTEYAEKYHSLGEEHHRLHKEKEILHTVLEQTQKEKERYKKNHLEAMKQRNDFECQLQSIYKSPKWKIANLIVLPFKPFKFIVSKILPYLKEFYHSIKDIDGYRKIFGNRYALDKLKQLTGQYTNQTVKNYLKEKNNRVGVLFLSDEQSNCYRYRVLNQMEQLNSSKIFAKDISVNYPRINSLINVFDVFIFLRPHDTARNIQLAKEIKKQGKIIIFENDDLIFSPKAMKDAEMLKTLPKDLRHLYKKGIGTKIIKMANYGLTTTETIAKEMKRMGLDTFINRNVLNSEIIKISTNLPKNVEKDDTINIGYFSGSKTHDGDFSLVKKVLLKILAKYDNARIITAGYINLDKEFEKFKERIIVLPFVNWRELPLNIQKADINIVPLRDCIFNHAKSELKYLEAGILKIPTIASATTPYEFAIKDGFNGFIAKDEKEWTEKLENLIDNKDLRKKIGENAYKHIHNNYTTQARESQFTKYILDIVEANKKK